MDHLPDVADERDVWKVRRKHPLRGRFDIAKKSRSIPGLMESEFDASDAGEEADDGTSL
jgi:hypothetical protein